MLPCMENCLLAPVWRGGGYVALFRTTPGEARAEEQGRVQMVSRAPLCSTSASVRPLQCFMALSEGARRVGGGGCKCAHMHRLAVDGQNIYSASRPSLPPLGDARADIAPLLDGAFIPPNAAPCWDRPPLTPPASAADGLSVMDTKDRGGCGGGRLGFPLGPVQESSVRMEPARCGFSARFSFNS